MNDEGIETSLSEYIGIYRQGGIFMEFNKKDFYGIASKDRKRVQITIDQDCNVPDTKPDVER